MIEHLFITTDRDGRVVHSPGAATPSAIPRIRGAIRRVLKPLYEDCPVQAGLTAPILPTGLLWIFIATVGAHGAQIFDAPDPVTRFSLEDVFADGAADKLAWVSGCRNYRTSEGRGKGCSSTPSGSPRTVSIESTSAAQRRCRRDAGAATRTGRLFIWSETIREQTRRLRCSGICRPNFRVVGQGDGGPHKAQSYDQSQLLHSRRGEFAVSYETSGGWSPSPRIPH